MKKSFLGRSIFAFLLLFEGLTANAIYEKLDSVLLIIPKIRESKENKIEEIKNISDRSGEDYTNLELLDHIFEEYKHYDYDSAMYYADRIYQLAEFLNDEEYTTHSLIETALLNTRTGNLEVADIILEDLYPEEMSRENLKDFNQAKYLLNLNLRNASEDPKIRQDYHKAMVEGLRKMIENTDKNSNEYYYAIAEKLRLVDHKTDSALKYYQIVVDRAPRNSELYASAAYSIAQHYKKSGEIKLYKDWLIKTAVSEASIPMNDRNALEELAVLIYQEDPEDAKRATKYLLMATNNALNYNNGHRIKEITEKLPAILPVYLENSKNESFNFSIALLLLILFVGVLAFLTVHLKNQNIKIQKKRNRIKSRDKELSTLNEQLNQYKEEVTALNKALLITKKRFYDIHLKRENLAKVWIDVCEAHSNKIKSFRKMVSEKVKTGQSQDLLNTNSFRQMDEEDVQSFLSRFDKAFLELYPNFPDEINKLLKENSRIILKVPNTLTTELRICALIKLGVEDSSEMADLLFASSQTIYNNRTRLRNRALDKDTLEEKITQIN